MPNLEGMPTVEERLAKLKLYLPTDGTGAAAGGAEPLKPGVVVLTNAEVQALVTRIYPCDVLTNEWLSVAQTLVRLEAVASACAAQHSAGKKKEDVMFRPQPMTTLWDRHEPAIRILVEDGKLNLLCHLLHAASTLRHQNSERLRDVFDAACARHGWNNNVQASDVLASFITCAASLLATAFYSIEALQVCDLPLVFEAVGSELASCARHLPFDDTIEAPIITQLEPLLRESNEETALARARRAPFVQSLAITHAVLQRCSTDEYDEQRVLNLMIEHGFVASIVAVLHAHVDVISESDCVGCRYVIQMTAEMLGLLMGCEMYRSRAKDMLPPDVKAQLEKLKVPMLTALEMETPRVRSVVSQRTMLRGLRDSMRWYGR
ncbi:hypothetical protein NFJ02_30g78430 [Pycnococcus provasolii]